MKSDYVERYNRLLASSRKLQARLPDPMIQFGHLHKAAVATGALSTKVKELIALGIAISVHCDGCIACHIHDALCASATRQEVLETIGVAVLMSGGPSMVHGTEAFDTLERFEAVEAA